MIEPVPYQGFHANGLINAASLLGVAQKSGAYELERRGPGLTAIHNNEPVGAGGVYKLWKGVGEAWLVATPWLAKRPLFLVKAAKTNIELFSASLGLHRLQAYVDAEEPKHQRFAEYLGFGHEATLKEWGPDGHDYRLYVRFF